jgi:hypothetical protein
MWLGVLLILGIDCLLVGFVAAVVLVASTGTGWWQDRRQARRFAEALARGDFDNAEVAARRAFQAAGKTDHAV